MITDCGAEATTGIGMANKTMTNPRKNAHVKVYVETYGCTLNQADSDLISWELRKRKYASSDSEKNADVVIINTCTVKSATENKIVERIRRLVAGKKPIVISGCMSANEKLIRKIAPNAPIVGTASIFQITNAIEDALSGIGTVYKNKEDKETLFRPITAPIMRIPICEGCTNNCYFCQTKIARPFLFSYRPKTILRWIEDGVTHGAKEIQLTAMDTGVYGMGIKTGNETGSNLETNLPSLLSAICKTKGNFRVRLGMINPQHAKRMCEQLISAMTHKKMYKFLHVPVQSGSERVCRDMNRKHTVKDFVAVAEAARKKIPNITIATDIIVGYPTETEADFEDTVRLMEKVKPEIVNVSKFSPRDGTIARGIKQLSTQVVKGRSVRLTAVVRKIGAEKNKKFLGRIVEVLITGRRKQHGVRHSGDYTGRTIEYRQVAVKGFTGKIGDWVNVRIARTNYSGLVGITPT